MSVITPSLNQGRFIEQAIRSVLEQNTGGRSLEYVVVDGGSRDNTVDILQRYPQVRWISESDRGQADAVNKGLRVTSGDIVGWLNSDDLYYPGAIRAACDFLESRPEVDLVYGDADTIDERGVVLGKYPTEAFDFARLKDTCLLCQPAVFFRRRVVDRFGGLDDSLHIVLDYEYWLRIAHGGATFGRIPQVVAAWRLYPEIKSVARRMEMHLETNRMFQQRFGRVPERWLYNYAHARLERTSIHSSQPLRFAIALALLTTWASLRWNHGVPPSVRQTTLIWLKDGLKLSAWSLRGRVRARVR